ncbi:MAG: 5-guanidino-2-oxopentanoate decarboxylase [Proteobacteria bacterium]|nr:5-guanidino-2-oxopentanoate decarboxylase [Pseudomonadota bacterium]
MRTCGEELIQLLQEYGVETVFGIPGVHTVELYRALPTSSVRHVTPRHEQGAGFMADGYARASGKPGVCLVITGPGTTNILTAMGQAYADSIPMLVISSVNRTYELGHAGGRLHELTSQRSMVAGVTAFSHTLMRPDELPDLLDRAFTLFASARPRPVHIEIPLDVITQPLAQGPPRHFVAPAAPGPDPQAIGRAVHLMRLARKPLLLLGGGAIAASREATQLAQVWDVPTAYTINAKGILPKDHPLSLGSNQSLPPVRALAAEADIVLAIGTELGETDYDVVFDGGFRLGGRLIRIDIDPAQLQRNFAAEVAIASDARLAIQALLRELPPASRQPELSGSRRASLAREQLKAHWAPAWTSQYRVLDLIQQALPEVIIVGDSTQPVYSGNHMYEATQTRSWFNSSTGYGTLGYALPAAIGARLAAPQRPVVCLIGDGGIQFTLPELASAVEAGVPIIVLLWNNRGYGEIKRYMLGRNIEPVGVDIYTPDFLILARGFGCDARRPTSWHELRESLLAAAAATRPTVIEVMEDAEFLRN